jgi:SAM-dependent methyltransferase
VRVNVVVTSSRGHSFRLEPWSCPTCGPAGKRVLGHRGGRFHRYDEGVETPIVRCTSCGLIYPDPFPVPIDRGEAIYGDPAKYFRDKLENLLPHYRRTIADLRQRVRVDDPFLLDIGSGRGGLLAAASDVGIRAVGLELAPAMAEFARAHFGVDVQIETVEEHADRLATPTYDAFLLAAVLEHMHNPDSALDAIARLAKPGAVLYLDLPNEPNLMTRVGNFVERIRGRHAVYNLSPSFEPYHVYGFSLRPLDRLLANHGFAIESRDVWAAPRVPTAGRRLDRSAAAIGTLVNHLANMTGTASNQIVWARWAG